MHGSWQSRLVHASTATAEGNPCCLRSNMPSTCGGGLSGRQDILGCVVISVVEAAAAGAGPLTDREREALQDVLAVRAPFAAGEVPIDGLQVPETLLEGNTGDVPKPDEVGFLLPKGQGCTGLGISDLGLVFRVGVLSERKRSVVNGAHAPKCPAQDAPLGRTRVEPELVAYEHVKLSLFDMSKYKKNRSAASPPRPKGQGFLAVT
jgi:hypothetical protein